MINFSILIVDDNPIIQKMMSISLLKAGYEVSSAGNGREALRKFDQKFYQGRAALISQRKSRL